MAMMFIHEAESVLPEGDVLPSGAFKRVIASHPRVLGIGLEQVHQLELEEVAGPMSDYFTAGVGFLTNRVKDDYLSFVGFTTWRSVNKQRSLVGTMGDVESEGKQFRMVPEPQVAFANSFERNAGINGATVWLPREFVWQVQQQPVDALASIAWVGSQIRDMEYRRLVEDPWNVTPRALATEAHFLGYARRLEPGVNFNTNSTRVLQLYPLGLDSLEPQMRY